MAFSWQPESFWACLGLVVMAFVVIRWRIVLLGLHRIFSPALEGLEPVAQLQLSGYEGLGAESLFSPGGHGLTCLLWVAGAGAESAPHPPDAGHKA